MNKQQVAQAFTRSGRRAVFAAGSLSVALAYPAAPAMAQKLDSLPDTQGLTVAPSVKLGYDDNLFRADGTTQPKVDDIIVTPGVTASFGRNMGRTNLQLAGEFYYDIFTSNGGLNKPRWNVASQAATRVTGNCYLQPFARYRRQRSDYGDILSTIPNVQEFTTASAEFYCKGTSGFYPTASITRASTDNTPLYRVSDQTSWAYSAGLGYVMPSLGTISAYYMYTDSDRRALGFNNRVDRAGLTFDRSVVSHLTLNLDFHWLRVRSTDPFVPRYEGVGWNSVVVVRPSSGLLIRGSTRREVANDPLVQAGYSINSTYALLGQVDLYGTVLIALSGERQYRDFKRNPARIFSPVDRDHQDLLVADVSHDLTARTRIGGTFSHITRRTGIDLFDFDANVASLSVAIRY